jgi:betaine reductase
MDLGNQARIKALVEEFGQDNIAVILGVADAEAAKLIGLTVTVGDPSYAGSLAGVQLGLPVAHILEDEVRLQIPSSVFEEQVGLMSDVLDTQSLIDTMDLVRRGEAGKGADS